MWRTQPVTLLERYLSCSRPSCPSCRVAERASSTVEQPSRQDGQGAPLTRGVPPCVPWKAQLPSSQPCCCSPSAPGKLLYAPHRPARGSLPPSLPQFKQASGSSDPGGYPLSSSGCRSGHLPHGRPLPRGLVPRRCTWFPEPASPETLLGFVPDWVVCNQINLLGGALHQALYLAGQDQKTLALLPAT